MSKKHKKIIITNEDKIEVQAQAPVIISASRSTDIPAFYSDWFFHRLEKGYIKWKNPFNNQYIYVSFKKTKLIVFWSKNPQPIIKHLHKLDDKKINYYFQYTINDYEKEKLETNVPSLDSRIKTFIKLSNKIGKEKVIWRFDPYILTDKIGVKELLKKTKDIGDQLKNYTNKLVFSFADIEQYRKVQTNLNRESINYIDFSENRMNEIARGLQSLNRNWGFEIGTCSEKIDLETYGIIHNKCIDDDLIYKLFANDYELIHYLNTKNKTVEQLTLFDNLQNYNTNSNSKKNSLKDKGQRKECNCIISKDIGQYNTCIHDCVYCYANSSKKNAHYNYSKHIKRPFSETITGE